MPCYSLPPIAYYLVYTQKETITCNVGKMTCIPLYFRISLDMFSVQGNTGPKWKSKIEKGFFRGRDSRQERLDLAAMSVKQPDLVDAKITNYFFFKKDEKKYGKPVKHISFFEFFKV